MSYDFAGGSDVTSEEAVGDSMDTVGGGGITIASSCQGEESEGDTGANVAAGHIEKSRFEEHCFTYGSLRQGDAQVWIGMNEAIKRRQGPEHDSSVAKSLGSLTGKGDETRFAKIVLLTTDLAHDGVPGIGVSKDYATGFHQIEILRRRLLIVDYGAAAEDHRVRAWEVGEQVFLL